MLSDSLLLEIYQLMISGDAKMIDYGKLYTIGYASLKGVEQLQEALAPNVLIIDIRYYPASRWRPEWSRKRLMEKFAANYCHIRELGNINYRSSELPITLLDAKTGISQIISLLQNGHDICLLCACSDWRKCHRRVVTELLQSEVVGIEAIHFSPESISSCLYS